MAATDIGRSAYRYRLDIPTRWEDCDAYGHVNNVVYYSFFDTAVTTMLYERGILTRADSATIGLCVESACAYHAPLEFPQTIEAWVRIGRIGDKSLRYEVAVFGSGDETASAAGHFVHVFVDRATRRPAALTPEQKAVLADLLVPAG
jgi:acyl-CoA thioester hydrolase